MLLEKWKFCINCQKGKSVQMELSATGEAMEKEGIRMASIQRTVDGCQLGEIRLSILIDDPLSESYDLALEIPVKVYIPMQEIPERITAMYLYNPWWTRPAFVDTLRDIPKGTQIALFKYKDRCGCFIPMVGGKFKTQLAAGTDSELCLEMTACVGGLHEIEEPLYLYAEGSTVTEAVHKAFAWLLEAKGILPRQKRKYPEMFRYLGWCSWDAFYTDVTEEKLRQKAAEFAAKQIPVKWMLIDDGWFPSKDKKVVDFVPDPHKFPNGFKEMARDIRGKTGIQWFGVWHALGGYWGGIAPDSPLAEQEAPYLYHGANACIVPSPETGSGFYRDWCALLKREQIDFIKVDGQSAAPFYFENHLPVSEAARGLNQALESGAYRMDGAIINCMGMAMENILARPNSAISRNSDDFLPAKEESFVEHLLQNAYNSLYHNEVYCCDWDMFWTQHKHAVRHSLLRAISGGPVYFSDKIGQTDAGILKPLAYADGRLLMMARSAKPIEDCVFTDPRESGVLKLHNVAPWGATGNAGGIAAYNLTGKQQTASFSPADIPDLDAADHYWIYDYFAQKACSLARNETYTDTVESEGFAWYVILPQGRNGSCLGLLDKYVGFTAVESICETDQAQVVILKASGTLGWISEKAPQKVLADADDVTGKVEQEGKLFRLRLPETTNKTVLTILW